MARHKATGRYYLTADKRRVVPHGDPDAAFLYCAVGSEVDSDEAKRLGLFEAELRAVREARMGDLAAKEPPAAVAPAPEPESKMVERQPEHKAVAGPRARDAKD
jgi:hypothetical protein